MIKINRPTVCLGCTQIIYEMNLLMTNDDINNVPKVSYKLANKVTMLSAGINNCIGNVLIGTVELKYC